MSLLISGVAVVDNDKQGVLLNANVYSYEFNASPSPGTAGITVNGSTVVDLDSKIFLSNVIIGNGGSLSVL